MVFDQKYWRKKAKENNSTVTINTEGITLSKFLRDTLYKKKNRYKNTLFRILLKCIEKNVIALNKNSIEY